MSFRGTPMFAHRLRMLCKVPDRAGNWRSRYGWVNPIARLSGRYSNRALVMQPERWRQLGQVADRYRHKSGRHTHKTHGNRTPTPDTSSPYASNTIHRI